MEEEPEVLPDLYFVISLFNVLNSSRPRTGFGPTPIPITDILALLDLYGVEDEQRVELFELLHHMDKVWMEWAAKEAQRKS